MYTNQEAFDKVVRHLVAQGRPAINANGSCAYLSEDGRKCAAGCLIPEDVINLDFGGTWPELRATYPNLESDDVRDWIISSAVDWLNKNSDLEDLDEDNELLHDRLTTLLSDSKNS